MLDEIIRSYIKAQDNKDTKEMERLQNQVSKLGMDMFTLNILANEIRKEN